MEKNAIGGPHHDSPFPQLIEKLKFKPPVYSLIAFLHREISHFLGLESTASCVQFCFGIKLGLAWPLDEVTNYLLSSLPVGGLCTTYSNLGTNLCNLESSKYGDSCPILTLFSVFFSFDTETVKESQLH